MITTTTAPTATPVAPVPRVGHAISPLADGGNQAFVAAIPTSRVPKSGHETYKGPRTERSRRRKSSKRGGASKTVHMPMKPDFGEPDFVERGSGEQKKQAWLSYPLAETNGREYRPRGFSVTESDDSMSSGNWSTKSRYLMAVRAGPTELPDHILAKHPLFRKNDLPSPFTLFYYDETAPNDILLRNDLKDVQKHAVKRAFCRKSKRRARRRGSDWTSNEEVRVPSSRSSSSVREAPVQNYKEASSTRSDTSTSSSSSRQPTRVSRATKSTSAAKPRGSRCCGSRKPAKHQRVVSYTASTLVEESVSISSSYSNHRPTTHKASTHKTSTTTRVSRPPVRKTRKACCEPRDQPRQYASQYSASQGPAPHYVHSESVLRHTTVPTRTTATHHVSPSAPAGYLPRGTPNEVSYVHVVPLYASHKNTNTFPRADASSTSSTSIKYMSSTSDSYVTSSSFYGSSTGTSFSTSRASPERPSKRRGKCCKHQCCGNNATHRHVSRAASFTDSVSQGQVHHHDESSFNGTKNPFLHGDADNWSDASDHTLRDFYPVKQKERKRNMNYHTRKLYFEADDLRVPHNGTAYKMLPSYSTSYKNYPVICYDVLQPENYKGFFRERKAPSKYF